MWNLVGCTNSYVDPDGTPPHPPEANDNERLLQPCAANAATASRRQEHTLHVKRTLGDSRSTSVSKAPPVRRRFDKLQTTADLPPPAPHTTAPAPRPDGLANVVTPGRAVDAPGRTTVDQNNLPRDAAEMDDNPAVFYDALTTLPAFDDSVEANNVGPSADVGNVDNVLTMTGLLAWDHCPLGLCCFSSPPNRPEHLVGGRCPGEGWVPETSMATSETLSTTAP